MTAPYCVAIHGSGWSFRSCNRWRLCNATLCYNNHTAAAAAVGTGCLLQGVCCAMCMTAQYCVAVHGQVGASALARRFDRWRLCYATLWINNHTAAAAAAAVGTGCLLQGVWCPVCMTAQHCVAVHGQVGASAPAIAGGSVMPPCVITTTLLLLLLLALAVCRRVCAAPTA
jgi:hypothetical protein